MLKCPSCGQDNISERSTCKKCGGSLAEAQAQTPAAGNSTMDRFLSDQQDPAVAAEALDRIKPLLISGEEVSYVAVQKPIMNMRPSAVILTNKRFLVYRRGLIGGANFEDYIWRDFEDATLKEGMLSSSLTMRTVQGRLVIVGDLPKVQARRLYSFAQEQEERVLEERRQRELEDKRASAGGIQLAGFPQSMPVQQPVQTTPDDPIQRLGKLKAMLDAGLITQEDYDKTKQAILSSMV